MIKFETFESLEQYLDGHARLRMLSPYLQECVDKESEELFSIEKRVNKLRSRAKTSEESTKDAKFHYLEEINLYLETDIELTPMSIIGYRRKQHAWAIATTIKEFENERNKAN